MCRLSIDDTKHKDFYQKRASLQYHDRKEDKILVFSANPLPLQLQREEAPACVRGVKSSHKV